MNIIADTHAKIKASTPPPHLFHTSADIYMEWKPIKFQQHPASTVRIHSRLDSTLYDLLTIEKSRSYWTKKMKVPKQMVHTINWRSLSIAFSNLNPNKKKEVLKWLSGFCATNSMLYLRKQATSAECPGCQHPNETTVHVIKCQTPSATAVWNEAISGLKRWMTSRNAAPELADTVIFGLQAWRNNYPALHRIYSLPYLTAAVTAQNQIGWRGFLHGFTARDWETAQHTYLQFKSSKMTGKRWIAALIKKLWETIWALWRYRNGLVHEETNTPLKKINSASQHFGLKRITIRT